MKLHALPAEGRQLPADTDQLLMPVTAGSLLLINLPPGEYAYESHRAPELIVCLTGTLIMQDETGFRLSAQPGEMIEIPVGLSHRFAPDCDAVVLTLTQTV